MGYGTTLGGTTPEPVRLIGRGLIAQSPMLEEEGPERLTRVAAFGIPIFVAVFIGWASLARVSDVVVASGEVLPVGSVRRVRHPEEGLVTEIRISEGDLVEEGQVLMVVEPSTIVPELEPSRARLKALEFRAAQLRSIISGTPFGYNGDEAKYAELARSQAELLESKRRAVEAQAQVLRRQIGQQESDLALLSDQERSLKKQVAILEEQVSMRRTLTDKGLTSKVVLLNDQRQLARAEGWLAELTGQKRVARKAIALAESRLLELAIRTRMHASEELGKVTAEIIEQRESVRLAEDRIDRLRIHAPVSGIVQDLQAETIGGVISPGSTLFEVVPFEAELIVETHVAPRDIGGLYPGQYARVEITAYDATGLGGIDGRIETISAAVSRDEKGDAFYRIKVRLDRNYVGDDPTRNLVVPGMDAVVTIEAGARSLLAHLLEPVSLSVSKAFRQP